MPYTTGRNISWKRILSFPPYNSEKRILHSELQNGRLMSKRNFWLDSGFEQHSHLKRPWISRQYSSPFSVHNVVALHSLEAILICVPMHVSIRDTLIERWNFVGAGSTSLLGIKMHYSDCWSGGGMPWIVKKNPLPLLDWFFDLDCHIHLLTIRRTFISVTSQLRLAFNETLIFFFYFFADRWLLIVKFQIAPICLKTN